VNVHLHCIVSSLKRISKLSKAVWFNSFKPLKNDKMPKFSVSLTYILNAVIKKLYNLMCGEQPENMKKQ